MKKFLKKCILAIFSMFLAVILIIILQNIDHFHKSKIVFNDPKGDYIIASKLHDDYLNTKNEKSAKLSEKFYLLFLKKFKDDSTNKKDKFLKYSALFELARLYDEKKIYSKAFPAYQNALDYSEKNFGNKHLSVACVYANTGTMYLNKHLFKKAEIFYKKAYKICLNPDLKDGLYSNNTYQFIYKNIANNLKTTYIKQNKFNEAITICNKAIIFFNDNPNKIYELTFISLLASIYQHQNKYSLAAEQYNSFLSHCGNDCNNEQRKALLNKIKKLQLKQKNN